MWTATERAVGVIQYQGDLSGGTEIVSDRDADTDIVMRLRNRGGERPDPRHLHFADADIPPLPPNVPSLETSPSFRPSFVKPQLSPSSASIVARSYTNKEELNDAAEIPLTADNIAHAIFDSTTLLGEDVESVDIDRLLQIIEQRLPRDIPPNVIQDVTRALKKGITVPVLAFVETMKSIVDKYDPDIRE